MLNYFRRIPLLTQPSTLSGNQGIATLNLKVPTGLSKGWYEVGFDIEADDVSSFEADLEICYRNTVDTQSIPLSTKKRSDKRTIFFLNKAVTEISIKPIHNRQSILFKELNLVQYPAVLLACYAAYRFVRACILQKGAPLKHLPLKQRLTFLRQLLYPSSGQRSLSIRKHRQISDSYNHWMMINEQSLTKEYYNQKDCRTEPKISVIMPVYNTKPTLLKEAIESVIGQYYSNWELCIADDCSTDSEVRTILDQFTKQDWRIKVSYRTQNGHISACSNTALKLATGEYVALLDHDDLLAPNALSEIVLALHAKPEIQFIYSDQDLINEKGERSSPMFKPQFSPDLFYSQNYLNHLTLLKTERLRALGGWRVGYEGAQDYDLYLRYLHQVPHKEIHRIPKVLYHWRITAGSTASGIGEKSYAVEAGRLALEHYFQQNDSKIEVSTLPNLPYYRVKRPVPASLPLVSIIIPTKDNLQFLKPCIDSVLDSTTYKNYEILIIDNNSESKETAHYFDSLSSHKNIRVIPYDKPFNYSKINNEAVKHAKGEYLCFMNNDIKILTPGWLEEMLSQASRPDIGCVGAKLYYKDDSIQHSGVILGLGGYAAHAHRGMPKSNAGYYGRIHLIQNYSAVTAALLLIKKERFLEAGGYEEEKLAVAYNDVDLCLKVRSAGYNNLYTPYATAYHYESKTRGKDALSSEKMARLDKEKQYLYNTWQPLLQDDPHYSPNLTRDREDFSL